MTLNSREFLSQGMQCFTKINFLTKMAMHLKKCKHKIITTYPTNTDIEYHTPFFPTDTTNEMITDRTEVQHENYSSHHEANNYPTRSSLSPNFQELEQEPFNTTINGHQPTYRSLRTKRTFTYLEDYICQQASFHSSQNYDKNKGLHNLGNHFPLTTTHQIIECQIIKKYS